MSGTAAVVLSLALAALVMAAFTKPGKQLVSGLIYRDKKGRLVLVLTPVRKGRKKR